MSIDETEVIKTPDFRHYPDQPGLVDATAEKSWIRVRWADGAEARFHCVWLRDNAADARSIDAHSRERLFDITDFSTAIRAAGLEVDRRGALIVDWGDRVSAYHPGWLRAYAYDLEPRDKSQPAYRTWDGSMADSLPTFAADDISTDKATRLEWLRAIKTWGITLVSGSPTDAGEYIQWLERLLLIRDMNWGKHFDVVYQADGQYISNKGVDIPPHNDAATRPHMPGIQIFHCLENTVEGGESYWVDGFHVAETLRRESPRDFELLSSVPWSMANRNADSEYLCRAPFIEIDDDGHLHQIRHTHWLREPLLTDFDLVEPMYAAYRRFVEIAGDPAVRINHRLQPGEVSFIDNPRIFHARGPYLTGEGERHMQVSHSEREEVDSAIAVLERDLARAP